MSVNKNSVAMKAAASELMAETATALNALVMFEDMVSKGSLPAGMARACAELRDGLAARAEELRQRDAFISESGIVIQLGKANRVQRAG